MKIYLVSSCYDGGSECIMTTHYEMDSVQSQFGAILRSWIEKGDIMSEKSFRLLIDQDESAEWTERIDDNGMPRFDYYDGQDIVARIEVFIIDTDEKVQEFIIN